MTYLEQMKRDIRDYISENGVEITPENKEEVIDQLYDDLWAEDSVTGNGSGSYGNRYDAEDMVLSDGQQYVKELISEFCLEPETIADHLFDFEYWDVSIRCYLLGRAIRDAIEEEEN